MNFLKNLDKALDFDTIEKTVAEKVQPLAFVEEFPDRNKATSATTGKVVVTNSAVAKARAAQSAWEELDIEGSKDEWEAACQELKQLASGPEPKGAQAWHTRAKEAEYKLYRLYSTLLGLPDPAPLLENVAALSAKVLDLEESNRKLQATADHASRDEAEVSALVDKHNKLEAAHRELTEELARKDAAIAEMQAAAEEAVRVAGQVSEQAAEIGRLQAALRSQREDYETSQSALFELQSRLEAEAGSRQRESDIAVEDLERLSVRVAELEMERERLAVKLERERQQRDSGSGGLGGLESGLAGGLAQQNDDFWERQLTAKQEQLAALQAQLDAAKRDAADAEARSATQLTSAQNQLAQARLVSERLERELARRPDAKEYQELRQRADALQALVGVQLEAEGWAADAISGLVKAPTAPAVQNVLQERNRKLSAEVQALKRQVSEQATQLADAAKQQASLEQELYRRAGLIGKLEEDLAVVQRGGTTASNVPPPASSSLPSSSQQPQSSSASGTAAGTMAAAAGGHDAAAAAAAAAATVVLQSSSTSGLALSDAAGAASSSASGVIDSSPLSASVNGVNGGGGEGSLLDIVASQRDRFRQRVTQLEEEKGGLSDELRKVRKQLEDARSDNVALYEKVRYLERYSQKATASAGRSTVVRVDAAGLPTPSPQEAAASKANRYQCGPFAVELGGGGSGASSTGEVVPGQSGAGGAGSGGNNNVVGGGANSAGAGGMRARRRGGVGGGGNMALACFGDDGADDAEAGNAGPEARAARAYEARVNPFAEFQQAEAESRVKALHLHDRAVLAGSRMVAGSRIARIFVAVYALLLHLFVLLLIYYSATPCPPLILGPDDGPLGGSGAGGGVGPGAGAPGGAAGIVAKLSAEGTAENLKNWAARMMRLQ